MSFAEAQSAGGQEKRVTKRQRFLGEMEKVVPWTALAVGDRAVLPERGTWPVADQLIGLERMLRIYFLQQRYGLSDEALEDVLYDSVAMCAFCWH